MNIRPALIGALGIAVLAFTALPPDVRVVYNASDSAPRGWYYITHTSALLPGDLVIADLSPPVSELANRRRYLPRGIPILKHVGATAGQRVCIRDRIVSIDGKPLARALKYDGERRALPAWTDCRTLVGDEVFLFSARPEGAFDSRYFGPIQRNAVRGIAHPLWTWSTP